MKHEHLQEINSTQDYLLALNPRDEYLVSCERQTAGRGRYGRVWNEQDGSLSFSFSLKPSHVMTHSPLEVAVLINQFFENKLRLKWPNDLFDKDIKKCGGILIDSKGSNLIVGVGLNFLENQDFGAIGLKDKKLFKREMAADIYQYILSNRMHSEQVLATWEKYCIHMHQQVKIEDTLGEFIGLGPQGEAILKVHGATTQSFFSGSLLFGENVVS